MADTAGHVWIENSGTTDICGWCGCIAWHQDRRGRPGRFGTVRYSTWGPRRGWADWNGKHQGIAPAVCDRSRVDADHWARRVVEKM